MTASWQTVEIDGRQRDYLLAEPAGAPRAVILSLHGTRSEARGQVRLTRLDGTAVEAGAVAVFPQAVSPIGRGYEWDREADLPFLSRLVDELLARYPSVGGRVVLTGMSGGARMSCHFASLRPELVSLVGAVAGLRAPSRTTLSTPVPVYAFHGTSDRINPYRGSGTARWDESVPDAAMQWTIANGAGREPVISQVGPHVTRSSYGADGAPNEVVLWTVRGGGHTWPGSPLGLLLRLFLGKTTTEIDATALILAAPHLGSGRTA